MRLPLADAADQRAVDMAAVERMFDRFIERGFTYFDTAYMYHDFHSEEVVREALVRRHRRDEYTLASKLPTMFLKEEGDQERIFDEQLAKCGVDFSTTICCTTSAWATTARWSASTASASSRA